MSSNSKTLTIIVPAAGRSTRLQDVFATGNYGRHKAFLDLGGKPSLARIHDLIMSSLGSDVQSLFKLVIRPEQSDLVNDYLSEYDLRNFEIHWQEHPLGPLDAVLSAGEPEGAVLVWLADTLLQGPLTALTPDTLYTTKVMHDFSSWCLVATDKEKRVDAFLDKPASFGQEDGQALIGIYYLSQGSLFYRLGRQVVQERELHRNEFQLSSALDRYRQTIPLATCDVPDWVDIGSSAAYYKARSYFGQNL